MKQWSSLRTGDVIDLVAPGSGIKKEELESAIQYIKKMGFVPRILQTKIDAHTFHSDEDSVRLEQLKKALYARDSQAIWCLRGGYGANRLMPELLKLKPPTKNKILIGYSDITTLHLWLNQKWKWVSLHAPLLDALVRGKHPTENVEELWRILKGEQKDICFSRLTPMNARAVKLKKMVSTVIGGNLTVIQSTLGTKCALKTKNKILFLEETAERGYRVDRMLEHLIQARTLDGCKALVFGDFIKGDEADGSNHVNFALERFANRAPIPVLRGVTAGHGPQNRVVPFGTKCFLSAHELICLTGVKKRKR